MINSTEKLGVLLVNTGSPDAPTAKDMRVYLRQFLSDPRVIDISPAARWLLLNLVILPFRPKKSAHAYQQVWTDEGSPLIVNSLRFRDALREALPHALVEIGMAYGNPSLKFAIDRLLTDRAERLVVVPMFPQYASATVGSVLEGVYKTLSERMNVPPVSVVAPFYDAPGFLDAWAEVARCALDKFRADHVVLSYHGLPERHIRNCDESGHHCLQASDCCERFLDGNPNCYRAHCMRTTQGLVKRIGLQQSAYTLTFQSKLGRDPWLEPATDREIVRLAKSGVKRLAVISPTFVADCLETLEEIGIRAKQDFLEHGGEEFLLVPSLNADAEWVAAMADFISRTVGAARESARVT